MKEPKRYSCGNGEGMFEDNKNGDWVEYSEHKAIVEELTKKLRKQAVGGLNEQLKCGNSNPPCFPNIKFGCLECTECNWSE